MNSIEISFENPYLLLIFPAALLVILIPFFVLPKKRRSGIKRLIPVLLHTILAALMTLAIAGLTFTIVNQEENIIILADVSDSMRPMISTVRETCQEIKNNSKETDHISVVTFSGGGEQVVDFGGAIPETLAQNEEGNNATDISEALNYAASLFPAGSKSRMIVISDGKMTEGNAVATASAIKENGIRIDGIYIPTTALKGEAQVSSFTAPKSVFSETDFSISVTIQSECVQECHLVVRDVANDLLSMDLILERGINVIREKVQLNGNGSHRLRAEITPEMDRIVDNNFMDAYVNVAERSNVLIVTNATAESNLLRQVLSQTADVTVVQERQAPGTLTNILQYDEIILVNVSVLDLPKDFDKYLDSFVRDYGRTLITIGGKSTYLLGGMEGTKLSSLLPVDIRGDSGAGNIALIIVLDVSGSMNQNNRLTMAKEGAKLSVSVLGDGDMIGLVTFGRDTRVNVPLGPANEGSKDFMYRQIDGLTTQNNTNIYPAINQARDILERTQTAAAKHVLLLSDGSPTENYSMQQYERVVQGMAEKGITTSTIAIEPAASNGRNRIDPKQLMQNLATVGGGTYYEATSASTLSSIMLEATQSARMDSVVNESFVPVIAHEDKETVAVEQDELPSLGGFVYTSLRNGAVEVLSTTYDVYDEDDVLVETKDVPIYAYWIAGKGFVGTYLSDFNPNQWASNSWANVPSARNFVNNVVTARLPDAKACTDLSVAVIPGGTHAKIEVQTSEQLLGNEVLLQIEILGEETQSIRLSGDGKYFSTEIDLNRDIYYRFSVFERYMGMTIDSFTFEYFPGYSYEYDCFNTSGQANMTSICAAGGGEMFTALEGVLDIEMLALPFNFNPIIILMIVSAAILVVDIILRKLKMKDIRDFISYFRSGLKNRKQMKKDMKELEAMEALADAEK